MSKGDEVVSHGPVYDAVYAAIGPGLEGEIVVWVDGTAKYTFHDNKTLTYKWYFTKDWVLKVDSIPADEFEIIRDWAELVQSSDLVEVEWIELNIGERKGLRDVFVVLRDAKKLGGLAGEVMDLMMKFRECVLHERDESDRLVAERLVQA